MVSTYGPHAYSYNSFHHKLGYFLHLSDVISDVEIGVKDTVSASYICPVTSVLANFILT